MEPRPQLARFFGMLLTDGGISNVSGKWRMHFTNTSGVLNEEFKRLSLELFDRRVSREYRNGAVIQRAWVNSIIGNFLYYSESFRTQACNSFPICSCLRGRKIHKNKYRVGGRIFSNVRIPRFIFRNKRYAAEFLRYAFSCDGFVNLHIGKAKYGFRLDRRVELACLNPRLKKDYKNLLKLFDIESKICEERLRISRENNVKKFNKYIGFVKGVKVTGYQRWSGVEKSRLLKLAAKTYSMKNIFRMQSQEQIFRYFKTLL